MLELIDFSCEIIEVREVVDPLIEHGYHDTYVVLRPKQMDLTENNAIGTCCVNHPHNSMLEYKKVSTPQQLVSAS